MGSKNARPGPDIIVKITVYSQIIAIEIKQLCCYWQAPTTGWTMTTKPKKKAAGKARAVAPKRKQGRIQKAKTPAPVKQTEVFLEPDEFVAICREALGGRGWQKAFLSGTGMAQSTITRYIRGVFPIPKYVAMIVRLIQALRLRGIPLPEEFTAPTQQQGRDE